MLPKIPDTVKEDIDEIKTPSNRVLVTLLILSVITMFAMHVNADRQTREDAEAKYQACDQSKKKGYRMFDSVVNADNVRLRKRNDLFDSIQFLLLNKKK